MVREPGTAKKRTKLRVEPKRQLERVDMTTTSEKFTPIDPDYRTRVRASFDRQTVMRTIGATLETIEPGRTTIELPYREDLTQQHGFLHAGIIATVVDSASGYAAFTLMPADAAVLSIEFKINLLAPARGERFIADGSVLRPGRTITVCRGELIACEGERRKTVATLQSTIMTLSDHPTLTH